MTTDTITSLPTSTLPATSNQQINLQSYQGKNIVLYFYPKDNTPGCTTEAQDFKALSKKFDAKNTVIFGISKDSIASHEKFKAKLELPFELVSDEDGQWCEHFGAWGEKNMYGKKYMGIIRSTFIIDTEGNVKQQWYKVRVKEHANKVLEAL